MNNQSTNKFGESSPFFRFQVFLGDKDKAGSVTRSKNIGVAYLSEGQNIYSLRLWMFSWERYFLLPHRNDPTKFLIMTREANKRADAKNKYHWNIVGNGELYSARGVVELNFDLLEKTVYMNIFPEASAHAVNLPEPEAIESAA